MKAGHGRSVHRAGNPPLPFLMISANKSWIVIAGIDANPFGDLRMGRQSVPSVVLKRMPAEYWLNVSFGISTALFAIFFGLGGTRNFNISATTAPKSPYVILVRLIFPRNFRSTNAAKALAMMSLTMFFDSLPRGCLSRSLLNKNFLNENFE